MGTKLVIWASSYLNSGNVCWEHVHYRVLRLSWVSVLTFKSCWPAQKCFALNFTHYTLFFNSALHFEAEPWHNTIFWEMCCVLSELKVTLESYTQMRPSREPFPKGKTSKTENSHWRYGPSVGIWDTNVSCIPAVPQHGQQGARQRETNPPTSVSRLGTPRLFLLALAPSPGR